MTETLRLDAVQPGHSAQVVALEGDSTIRKRMTEMGLTKGAVIQVERIAPLGDPMDLRVRGYHLSLRKEEAARISVTAL